VTRSHQITADHVTVTVVTPPYGGSHHLVTPAVTLSSAPDDAGRPLHQVPADVRNALLDTIGDCRDALLCLQLDDDPHAAVVLLGRAARRASRVAASLAAGDTR